MDMCLDCRGWPVLLVFESISISKVIQLIQSCQRGKEARIPHVVHILFTCQWIFPDKRLQEECRLKRCPHTPYSLEWFCMLPPLLRLCYHLLFWLLRLDIKRNENIQKRKQESRQRFLQHVCLWIWAVTKRTSTVGSKEHELVNIRTWGSRGFLPSFVRGRGKNETTT